MFNNSTILLTGGTGSFGHEMTNFILQNFNIRKLIIYSRDEMKQWEMAKLFQADPRIRFFIGDVRDRERLYRAMNGVDYVIHAAATKIVPTAEYNPFECVKTNVFGAMNVVDACIDNEVQKVVALSTDKASNPINLYGATKLTSDKLFISGNAYSGEHGSKFSVVRYGNVMGSRGSVIPFFLKLKNEGQVKLPITDARMTRFMMTLSEAVKLVLLAFEDMIGGEIYVKKNKSMRVVDIAQAVAKEMQHEIIGIRPGEKLHEQMISSEDSPYTYEFKDYYKILSNINRWHLDPERIKNGIKVADDFCYRSDTNDAWMTQQELSEWVKGRKGDLL